MKIVVAFLLWFTTMATSAQQRTQSLRGDFDITGHMVNANTGEVLHRASLQLASVAQRSQVQQFEVGTDGAFAFHHLAPGKYSLSAQAVGFAPQSFEQHGNFSTAIAVGPNKTAKDIVFRVRPDGSISGRVLDEHNEPVREAQLMLFERGTFTGKRQVEPRGQQRSDDLGEYRFNHLGPGAYYLAVSAQPWYHRYLQGFSRRFSGGEQQFDVDPVLDSAYPLTYYPGTTDVDEAGAIMLHPGDRVSADFDLAPVPSLHLTIHSGEDGRMMPPNFRPRVFGEPFGFLQPNVTGRQGEIEISGIAPGDYDMTVFHPGEDRGNPTSQHVSLQQSGDLDASATTALARVRGHLKFDGSSVPPNTLLQFVDQSSGRANVARVDDQGEFDLQPPHPGRYAVALLNAPGYAIRSITAPGVRVSGRTIDFGGSEAMDVTIDATEGVGTVNGTVMHGDKGISGAMVVLVPQQISDNVTLFRRDQSDSDGTFTLPDVVPGRYTAIAIQNGWELEWASPETLRPYLAKGTPVEIGGKQKLDVVVSAQ